ncbi:uncharacterized protein METZ01_LOCUS108198, partial [marine metagenome]
SPTFVRSCAQPKIVKVSRSHSQDGDRSA